MYEMELAVTNYSKSKAQPLTFYMKWVVGVKHAYLYQLITLKGSINF